MAGLGMFVLLFAFASLAGLRAHIAEWDEHWLQRKAEARNRTFETYEPNPERVVAHLNMHTNRVLKEIQNSRLNSTRRGLAKSHIYQGPCKATNPVDQCWRCNPNWAQNRFKLVECVLGFGQRTTGGKGGRIYVVDDPSDNSVTDPKPGTLRYAVIQKEPLWIIFKHDMVIHLTQEMMMASDKTIDARGARVVIRGGGGITMQYVHNIIIHGLRIRDIKPLAGGQIRDSVTHIGQRTTSDGDGISMFGATNVWIDHVSMTNCYDGLIDAIYGSTGITITNGHFTDHNEVMLFGARDQDELDKKMQITVAFNHFGKRLVQRMPRARFGYVHVVNNDYTHWQMYAIGGSRGPTIISQGNRYYAPPNNANAREVTKRVDSKETESVWKNWTWRSEGDQFMNGAFFVESGDKNWYGKHPEVFDRIKPAPAQMVGEMTKFAGSLNCKVGRAC